MMDGCVDEALIALALMLFFDVLKTAPPFEEGSTLRRYIPHLAMGLGIVIYLVWAGVMGLLTGIDLLYAVLSGLISGASATGFHSTGVPDRVYGRAQPERG